MKAWWNSIFLIVLRHMKIVNIEKTLILFGIIISGLIVIDKNYKQRSL